MALATPAFAQRPVPVGARVQVKLFERQRQEVPRFPKGLTLRGEVVAQSADTLWIRPTRLTGVLAIPKSSMRRLSVSRGEPARGQSMVTEAIKGAFTGAIQGMLIKAVLRDGWFGGHSYSEVAGRGAAYGSAGGAVIGLLLPVEYWSPRRLRRD
jgi:hypothetical protein